MALRKLPIDSLERDRLLFPADDGIPMENTRHDVNHHLLMVTLAPYLRARGQSAFLAGNNFVYYDRTNPGKNVGPDFYVVLGAKDDPDRDCWRAWHENGLLPQTIVEMLSKSTANKDRVRNFEIYRDVLKTLNYFICDHAKLTLEGWVLRGNVYVPLLPDQHGHLPCEALGLSLGFHQGMVRWFTNDGVLLPTGEEQVETIELRAEAAERRAAEEGQRAKKERLRAEAAERTAEEERRLRIDLEARIRQLERGDDQPV